MIRSSPSGLVTTSVVALAFLFGLGSTVNAESIRVAGIGANSGNQAANVVFSSGDLDGSISRITASQFDSMSVAQLRADYDVLLFTWASPNLNADWTTRILPYLQLGGGVIWEDNANIGDLAPAVTGSTYESSGTVTVTPVSGLTDGINGQFDNSHIRFSSWESALFPFLSLGGNTIGLYGEYGAGRIVLTGPDQDYHASRGTNQYNFLVNELRWVSSGTDSVAPVPLPAAAWGGMALFGGLGLNRWRRSRAGGELR